MKSQKDKKALDKLYRRRDRFDLQPDFQREKVWSPEKEQKLMDTILKKWDIPKVYLNVIDEENFEVIDGQQRLNAIYKFFSNELPLSKRFSGEYGGFYYKDLPDKIQDIFDDYELDIVFVSDAADGELNELFARLQLGMPLNSAEKLNAMSGNMRNFVRALSENKFFKDKTPISRKRYAYQAICAQIVLLEKEGIRSAKFSDLQEFYKINKDYDENCNVAKKIQKIINYMDQIFDSRTSAFRNRASIISFYILLSELEKNKAELNADTGLKLKKFYIQFIRDLQNEIQKGADAEDAELIVYQSKVNQAADSKDSILKRHQILKRRLIGYDEFFKKFLEISKEDDEVVELKKKETIKELTDSCIELTTSINKIYASKNQRDLFKITTEVLKCVSIINTPPDSREDFKNVIECLYKMFYEGSGSLNRVPNNLLVDSSIFFDIKHLRTDVSHDIEHGKESDIERKKQTISNIYKKYTEKASLEEIDAPMLIDFQKKLLGNIKQELLNLKGEISK
jgi:hypothetical protein